MRGTVIAYNPANGMFAVQIDGGDCSVYDLVGGSLARLDLVDGDLDSSLCETLTNLSNGERLDVEVEGLQCSPQEARRLIAS